MTINLFAKTFALITVALGLLIIIVSRNKNEEAVWCSGYLVGSDVLFRMTNGLVFYEMHKYVIILYLLLALILEKKRQPINPLYFIYILLLLIGIAFTNIPFNASIRKAIAFNLSGPILLGVSAIYFFKRDLKITTILNALFIASLPILSMLSYLYLRTPSVYEIVFSTESNFSASGGFGPNQVATVLGFGVFIIAVFLFLRKSYSGFVIIDVLLLTYMLFRGLLTFSRGGILTAAIAFFVFVFFQTLYQKHKILSILKYLTILFFFGLATWVYTSDVTGGMLDNRYADKNSHGIRKKDVTTGRVVLIESQFNNFYAHPFFGIGVGSGKYNRIENNLGTYASHNEIGRLLSEHGLLGLIALLILLITPFSSILNQGLYKKSFLWAFYLFWFLTINHSAMRIAFPGFIYGLSLVTIVKDD